MQEVTLMMVCREEAWQSGGKLQVLVGQARAAFLDVTQSVAFTIHGPWPVDLDFFFPSEMPHVFNDWEGR